MKRTNVFGFSHSSQGVLKAEAGAPAACGSACGSGDKEENPLLAGALAVQATKKKNPQLAAALAAPAINNNFYRSA